MLQIFFEFLVIIFFGWFGWHFFLDISNYLVSQLGFMLELYYLLFELSHLLMGLIHRNSITFNLGQSSWNVC